MKCRAPRLLEAAGILRAAVAAHAAPLTAANCALITSKAGEKPAAHEVSGLSVMSLRPDHPFALKAPDGRH
jgi:hypothetical protein